MKFIQNRLRLNSYDNVEATITEDGVINHKLYFNVDVHDINMGQFNWYIDEVNKMRDELSSSNDNDDLVKVMDKMFGVNSPDSK